MTPVALPQHRAGAGPNKSPVPSSWNRYSINITCTFPSDIKTCNHCQKGTCSLLLTAFSNKGEVHKSIVFNRIQPPGKSREHYLGEVLQGRL